ncbi:MAG: membrane lipoprotein lipid attachment site-containing protein, partial [Bacteroidaceae bacterium]|nr:membrane lipoprotein lipid attachment site-containing protein [Bacteroidaceae bacterium]
MSRAENSSSWSRVAPKRRRKAHVKRQLTRKKKKTKNSTDMKKIFIFAAAALLLSGCQSKREKNEIEDKSKATIDSLQSVIAQSNSESEDM